MPNNSSEEVRRLEVRIASLEHLMRYHEHRGIESMRITYDDIFLTPVFFGGKTNGAATTQLLPNGWTLVRNGTGDYTLTHGLGDTNYAFIPSVMPGFAQIVSLGANSVNYETLNVGASKADLTHHFMLIQIIG